MQILCFIAIATLPWLIRTSTLHCTYVKAADIFGTCRSRLRHASRANARYPGSVQTEEALGKKTRAALSSFPDSHYDTIVSVCIKNRDGQVQ